MKNLLIVFAFLAAGTFVWNCQAEILVANFETGGVTPPYSNNGACASLNIVNNPGKTSLNRTDRVLYAVTTSSALAGGNWWQGITIDIQDITVSASTRYLHILMRTNIPKFEWDIHTNQDEWAGSVTSHPQNNTWFDYVVDLFALKGTTNLNGKTVTTLRIAFSCNETANRGKNVYVDEIVFNDSSWPRTNILANFEDIVPDISNTDGLHSGQIVNNPDPSCLNKTAQVYQATTASSNTNWWKGVQFKFQDVVISASNRYLHVFIYKSDGLPMFEFDLITATGEVWPGTQNLTNYVDNKWFDYVLDLNNCMGRTLREIRIVTYPNVPDQRNKTFYFDEMILTNSSTPRTDANCATTSIPININASAIFQTMESFSASDCWMGNFVGQWPGSNKTAVAKYLFSQNFDSNGNPEGIGLSLWRVNLGAGSYEQGENSGIGTPDNIMRRAECFLNNTVITSNNSNVDINNLSNYNWNKCAGQQYFMQQAKSYGCEAFEAFSNSPLVIYTKNGKAYSGSSSSTNMASNRYANYADYMVNVVKHFKDNGYNFKYISPVNEPQWSWTGTGQEGSPWTNAEIKSMVSAVNNSITAKGLSDTKILITEAGQWDYTYGQTSHAAGNQIYQFFDSGSSNYVGNLANVAKVIAGHSYWLDKKNNDIQYVRQTVKLKANDYDLKVYQTEWSMLELDGVDGFPSNWDYIDVALNMAKIIHSDITYGNAASWSYWTAMDMERWSHKNRFLLVRVRPNNMDYPTTDAQLKTEGSITAQPTLWALGNYSLFVRPGYKRISLTGASNLGGLMGTAYISPTGDPQQRIVAVFVNIDSSDKIINPSITGLTESDPVSCRIYETSASRSLNKTFEGDYSTLNTINIPRRSIVTLVFDLEKTGVNIVIPKEDAIQVYSTETGIIAQFEGKAVVELYTLNGVLIEKTQVYQSYSRNLDKGVYILRVNGQAKKFVKS